MGTWPYSLLKSSLVQYLYSLAARLNNLLSPQGRPVSSVFLTVWRLQDLRMMPPPAASQHLKNSFFGCQRLSLHVHSSNIGNFSWHKIYYYRDHIYESFLLSLFLTVLVTILALFKVFTVLVRFTCTRFILFAWYYGLKPQTLKRW